MLKNLTHDDPVATATLILAGITFFLVLSTWWLARQTRRAGEAFRVAERAYIKISHSGPLSFASNGVGLVPLRVENRGHTPAHVTDVRVNHQIAEVLPLQPAYGPESSMAGNGRLVGRMGFNFSSPIIVSPGELDAINQRIMNLYLVGYADYTDAFGHKYRSAFVRRYVPRVPAGENNLFFVNNSAEYEYDRRRRGWPW
jgi:hypothetical protein